MTVKLHSQTPSLLQDSTSLPAFWILTAESGFIGVYATFTGGRGIAQTKIDGLRVRDP